MTNSKLKFCNPFDIEATHISLNPKKRGSAFFFFFLTQIYLYRKHRETPDRFEACPYIDRQRPMFWRLSEGLGTFVIKLEQKLKLEQVLWPLLQLWVSLRSSLGI